MQLRGAEAAEGRSAEGAEAAVGVALGVPRSQGLHNPPPTSPRREQGLDTSQQQGARLTAWGPGLLRVRMLPQTGTIPL